MARGAARPSQGREGIDPEERRGRAAAAGAALGQGRQGLSLRHLLGREESGRAVQRALAAARLSFDVRARLHRALRVLLDDRRRLQRVLGASRASRRDAGRGVARTVREERGWRAVVEAPVRIWSAMRQPVLSLWLPTRILLARPVPDLFNRTSEFDESV